jgi:DMSO/TMAO reductase YedYZ molybdopterin-dependent catalytic subunit
MKRFIKNIFRKNSALTVDEVIGKRTFLSFFFFILLAAAGTAIWFWLIRQPPEGGNLGGIQQPLRKVLMANEKIFGKVFDPEHLVKSYPVSAAVRNVRVNGAIGMKGEFDPSRWNLQLIRKSGDTLHITLADIRKLPKTEIIYNFKCIEGWSQITWWGGVKFSDFVDYFHLRDESALRYVGMRTPDGEYYVGIDMPSAMQRQTLLCYEMNRQPLPLNQGYPLRLIIPVKYGIKSIKRIGTIFFSDERPPDYWAERGYDYYAGL